ncbi:hypothetical protein [Microvirga lotononidis]|uniref:Uncharacterized protein n=1 Tax=Microvirga lotononidis TaxID=864069 RepID=I4YRQ5_9HYPH|nr:hypothetical protein [Microvirga lotononidis]EIM26647.1 hypothetical protein MicloDRAFT_00031960 [Microvirga lotononidis]
MPNPLSAFGVRDIDYAMSVGMVMGEALDEGLVGMGLVAATALNRAQNPSAYLSRSAALGDVFAAPFSAETMVDATTRGRSLSGKGRQFSPTFNSNISGASTAGHANFKAGLEASLKAAFDPEFSPALGIRQDGFLRAQKAVEVAVKARDLGIDIGLGVEHFSAPGFERDAGVGRNRSRFGGHSVSPTGGWPAGVTAPTRSEFASRFAAAAALAGVDIPDDMVADITAHTNRAQIMAAAPIIQRQAQDYLSQELEQDVMPGLNYNDLVQRTGFDAVDVPDVTGQLGINPPGALGFAENFGITPDNEQAISPPDPIGRVDFAGYLDPVGPSPIDGPDAITGTGAIAPAGAFSGQPLGPSQGFTSPDAAALFGGAPMGSPQAFDAGWAPGFEGFSAPGLIDQASFDARFNGAIPERAIETGYPETDLGIVSPRALGMGETFGINAGGFTPSGFSAGVDAGPYGVTPDASAPSLEARNAMDRFEGAMAVRNSTAPDMTNEAIAGRMNADLGRVSEKEQQAYERAMSEYNREKAQYERDLAAYNAATKSFSATPTGFNTDISSLEAPVASGLNSFGLSGFTNPMTGSAVGPALAPQSLSRPTPPTRPSAPVAPAPVASVRTASTSGVPEGWSPGVGPDGWGGYMSGVGGLAGMDLDNFGKSYENYMSEMAATAPATTSSFGPFGWNDKTGLTIGGYASPLEALGLTKANPTAPQKQQPQKEQGFFEGWSTPGLIGGALGLATGGPLGAIMGYQGGKLGAQAFNAVGDMFEGQNPFGGKFDGFGNFFGGPAASWDNWDPATYGFGPGFNERGERSHTGRDESGNATVGDGSYGERSGTNPNNPQGIL